jgi:hypothetical protein
VVRRAVFDEAGAFETALTHAEDQDLVVRVLAQGNWQVCGLDALLVDYRTSVAGLSADLGRMHAGWLAMLDRARTVAPAAVALAERPARARFYRYLARRALRTGHPPRTAAAFAARAIRTSPFALIRHQPRRSALTFLGVLAALVLPGALVRRVVAN